MSYKIGETFEITDQGVKQNYILAQVKAGEVTLIGLTSGNRWHDPVYVYDIRNITEEEFDSIFHPSYCNTQTIIRLDW